MGQRICSQLPNLTPQRHAKIPLEKQGFASACLGAVIDTRRIWKDPEVTIHSWGFKLPELNCCARGAALFDQCSIACFGLMTSKSSGSSISNLKRWTSTQHDFSAIITLILYCTFEMLWKIGWRAKKTLVVEQCLVQRFGWFGDCMVNTC